MAALNAFNRMVAALLFIALIAASVVILLVATGAVEAGTLAPSAWFREQFHKLAELRGTDQTIATVGPAAVLAMSAMLLVFEIIPPVGTPKTIRLRDETGNAVSMPAQTIAGIADQAAMKVPGVIRANSTVRPSSNQATIQSKVALRDDANVVNASRALNQEIKSAVQERAGIKISQLKLNLAVERPQEQENGRRSSSFPSGHGGQMRGSR